MAESPHQSDRALIEAYHRGDKEAISRLIERHRRRVRDYIDMMVHNHDLSEDIAQETFIKVVKVIDEGRYIDNGKFLSWVMRIAHNQVIDHFRSRKQLGLVNESDTGYQMLGTLKFSEKTVEDEMVMKQVEEDVKKLIRELPDDQRRVVMMRYFEGKSFKQIAEDSGVSINTALGRMRYALINLRKKIVEKNLVLC